MITKAAQNSCKIQYLEPVEVLYQINITSQYSNIASSSLDTLIKIFKLL